MALPQSFEIVSVPFSFLSNFPTASRIIEGDKKEKEKVRTEKKLKKEFFFSNFPPKFSFLFPGKVNI
ncbi:hypothetical protein V6Z11_D05G081600 [Gossypium hirsutum]